MNNIDGSPSTHTRGINTAASRDFSLGHSLEECSGFSSTLATRLLFSSESTVSHNSLCLSPIDDHYRSAVSG